MDRKIIVRDKNETDDDQIENILNKNSGKNRHHRTVYIVIPKNRLLEVCLLYLV